MKKRSLIPQTKVKNPEPKEKNDNWVLGGMGRSYYL